MAVTPYQMPDLAAFNRPIADPNSGRNLKALQNYAYGLLTDPMARAEFGTGLLQGATTDLAGAPADIYSGAVDLAQAIAPQNAPQNRFFMTNPFYMLSQSGDLAEQASSIAGSEALGESVFGNPIEGYQQYRNPARLIGGAAGAGELALGKASATVAPYLTKGINYLTDAMPKPQVATPDGLLMDAPQQTQAQPQTLLMEGEAQDVTSTSRMSDVDELGFYSVALDAAKKLPMNKGTGQQFRKMLENAGVKKDEITFTPELDDLLSQDRVTKEELIDVIERNRVRLSETVLEGVGGGLDDLRMSLRDNPIGFNEAFDDVYLAERFRDMRDDFEIYEDDVFNYIRSNYGDDEATDIIGRITEDGYDSLSKFDKVIVNDALKDIEEANYMQNPLFEYEDLNESGITIRGNDDEGYQVFHNGEPVTSDYISSSAEAMVQAENYAYDANIIGVPEGSVRWQDHVESGGKNYRETLLTLPEFQGKEFVGSHYDDPNILVHLRTKDRVMDDGSDVLYVEEMQSDWQKGSITGFRGTEKWTKNRNEAIKQKDYWESVEEELKAKVEAGEKEIYDDRGFNRPTYSSAKYDDLVKHDESYRKILNDLQNATRQRVMASADVRKFDSAPDLAPFVGNADKYAELGVKRLITTAISENKPFISFSSGDVQLDRWNNKWLEGFYNKTIPEVAKKQVKKLDPDAFVGFKDVEIRSGEFEPRFTIEITPKMREKAKSGLPLFAIPAGTVVGAGLLSGEKEPQSQGLL